MSYRINVSRRKPRRYWTLGMSEYTYVYYFRINTQLFLKEESIVGDNLTDLTKEMRSVYPEPEFKVDVWETPHVNDVKVDI
jgi:hypothetical protein